MLLKTLLISTALAFIFIYMIDAKPIDKKRTNKHNDLEPNPKKMNEFLNKWFKVLDIIEEKNNEELLKGIKNDEYLNDFYEYEEERK
jgi:hypothetical protein